MRLAVPLLAFGLFAVPALAQPPAAAGAVAVAKTATACPAHHRTYLSLAKRFALANTSHDGRLTLAQAKVGKGMRNVARHFDEIDATHKGYVTEADIKAWYKARRAAYRTWRETWDAKHKS